MKKNIMNCITRSVALALALVLTVAALPGLAVRANAASERNVKIVTEGQIVDTFNGVPAKYIPGSGNSNTGTYCCAQYVKNYYKTVFNVNVSNLTSNKTPVVSEKGYTFKQITSGILPGDVVRLPGHWAIVKSVNGNALTLIEQNWKWVTNGVTYAKVDRVVTLGSTSGLVVFRLYKNGQSVNGGSSAGGPRVKYESHLSNIGWTSPVYNGTTSGTTGRAIQMEAIKISLEDISGGITYRAHVSEVGWQNYVSNGAVAGTTGKSLQMEAIQIKLTGTAASKYSVVYRVHVENIGWMDWVKDGAVAGTIGKNLQIEAIQIKLVEK